MICSCLFNKFPGIGPGILLLLVFAYDKSPVMNFFVSMSMPESPITFLNFYCIYWGHIG